jgi:hypothetical protein
MWIRTLDKLPQENIIVETKILDIDGYRNKARLIFYKNLWWFEDKSMYVYYRPTHWRKIN